MEGGARRGHIGIYIYYKYIENMLCAWACVGVGCLLEFIVSSMRILQYRYNRERERERGRAEFIHTYIAKNPAALSGAFTTA